jgi:hypothetical protein
VTLSSGPQQSGGCAAIICPVVQATAINDGDYAGAIAWQSAQVWATLASPFRGINAPVPSLTGAPGTFHPAAAQGSFACGSYQCTYEMGPYSYMAQTGAWISVSVSGGLGMGNGCKHGATARVHRGQIAPLNVPSTRPTRVAANGSLTIHRALHISP